MANLEIAVCILSMMVSCGMAAPRGFRLPDLQKLSKPAVMENQSGDSQVADMGKLSTAHAVGIALHPTKKGSLIYADETAVYEFDKATGKSTVIAGKESSGLLAMRSSVDGIGTEAAFKYITKIVSRPSGLYVFDYDKLRKLDTGSKKVTTLVASLSTELSADSPVTGTISKDERDVYWTATSKDGHLVMKMAIAKGKLAEAEIIIGGPTLIGHLELSSDEEYLLLVDVDMALIEKVKIDDKEMSFVTKYGTENFIPGAIAANGDDVYIVNREAASIDEVAIEDSQAKREPVCDKVCLAEIRNPFDIVYDSASNKIFVLDGVYHPTLPTYIFSIKSIAVTAPAEAKTTNTGSAHFNRNLLKFYSAWFAAMNKNRNTSQ